MIDIKELEEMGKNGRILPMWRLLKRDTIQLMPGSAGNVCKETPATCTTGAGAARRAAGVSGTNARQKIEPVQRRHHSSDSGTA